jgi:hypothetical protein
MATEHTPGPWELCYLDTPKSEIGAYVQKCVDVGPNDRFFFLTAKRSDGVAVDVAHLGNGPTSEVNARLIAAAPELLEALQEFVMSRGTTAHQIDKARLAIAKVTA